MEMLCTSSIDTSIFWLLETASAQTSQVFGPINAINAEKTFYDTWSTQLSNPAQGETLVVPPQFTTGRRDLGTEKWGSSKL